MLFGMAKITICDHRSDKGEPCGNRAEVTASLDWDSKRWEVDLCDVHSKALTANAREAAAQPKMAGQVTKLPTAGPKFTRTPEFNEWAAKKGYKIAPKGAVKKSYIEEWEAER